MLFTLCAYPSWGKYIGLLLVLSHPKSYRTQPFMFNGWHFCCSVHNPRVTCPCSWKWLFEILSKTFQICYIWRQSMKWPCFQVVQICGKIQAEFKPVTILQGHFSILTCDLSSKMGIGCGLLKQPCFMIPMSMYGSCYDIKGVKKNIQYILPILCQLYAFKWKLICFTHICVWSRMEHWPANYCIFHIFIFYRLLQG